MEENSAQGPRNEIWWKDVFYTIFFKRKMVQVVIDRYFSLFLKGLKIFLNPMLSLIVGLSLDAFYVRNDVPLVIMYDYGWTMKMACYLNFENVE